jgi:cell wall-associated NlpC family hydrolase
VPASVIAAQQAQEAASQKKNEPAPSSNPGAVIGNADLAAIVDIAWSGIGVPYVSGGSSLSGFDCSGYTSWVYRQVGISIPRFILLS